MVDTDQLKILAAQLGYKQLKDEQVEVISKFMHGNDCFFSAPTGYGKSLLFQVAPLLYDIHCKTNNSCVIVIVPTISLAIDASEKIKKLRPEAVAVHLTKASLELAVEATYIFSSPESMLASDCGRKLLQDAKFSRRVKALFIDESHIVRSWGGSDESSHPFREQYGHLANLRSYLDCPVIAMTATADESTKNFVIDSLFMTQVHHTAVNINKQNISYHGVHAADNSEANFQWLVDILLSDKNSTPRMLIFFTKTAMLNAVYLYVTHHINQNPWDTNPLIAMFSKLTSDKCKQYVMTQMTQNSNLRVVLCTSSLAVGVNLSAIEYVIHYGIPSSVNDFLQESGRAAREPNSTGTSIVIAFPHMVRKGTDKTMRQYASKALTTCRRATLLHPFNVAPPTQDNCCDICQPEMLTADPVFSVLHKQIYCTSTAYTSSSTESTD